METECTETDYLLLVKECNYNIVSDQENDNNSIDENSMGENSIDDEFEQNQLMIYDIENQLTDKQCVVCFNDINNNQIFTCTRCEECKLCFDCTMKVLKNNKCPVCRKKNGWCKNPDGFIVIKKQKNRIQRQRQRHVRNNCHKDCNIVCSLLTMVLFGILLYIFWNQDQKQNNDDNNNYNYI